MAMRPLKDFATLLTESGKPGEALLQLLQGGGQSMLSDLPTASVDAIISTGLDAAASVNVRTLAYQIINSGQLTAYSEKYLERLVPIVSLDLSMNEDRELGLLALTSLLAMVKDAQLLPLFRDSTFLDALKTAMAHPESALLRQAVSEVVGRALPRVLARLDQPSVLSGTFPSLLDAQRMRQEARDGVSDLVRQLWEGAEDADDGVSAAAFSAIEQVLLAGCPRLLRSEQAMFFNQPAPPPPSAAVQEVVVSYFRMGLTRLPRLLLRFAGLRRTMRTGAIGTLSCLLLSLLLDSTSQHGMYLPAPSDKTLLHTAPSAAVRWSGCTRQLAAEWLQHHLASLAAGSEPSEALAAATWGIELLHVSALRPYRKALALVFMEALLRQPSLVQPRPLRPFSRPLNDRQAAPLVYAVSALKWLSLSAYEAVVPRLLQAVRWVESDSCRASCLGEVVSLLLCDVQRNGRVQDPWVVKRVVGDEWVWGAMSDEAGSGQFREELLTALLLSLLKLAPIVFLPIGLQVKLGPQLDNRSIPAIDLSYYSRIASVTRITRKAITKPAPFSSQYSRSSSDAVAEPFWLQNCGRWIGVTLHLLQRLSVCANWSSSSSSYSTFSLYLTLLSLACAVLLSPMRHRLDLRPDEMDEFREALKAVLLDLLSFKLPEGVTNRPLRLKVLRILSHYVGCMGSDDEARDQMAADLIRFLNLELTNQENVDRWREELSSRRARGPLGGGRVHDPPGLAEALWRARIAMHCLQQVALNVKSSAPQVLACLDKSIAHIDQFKGADFFFRDDVQATATTIRACLGVNTGPTAANVAGVRGQSPVAATPLADGPGKRREEEEEQQVMLVEPVLLPSMEPDGRVIYRHDRSHHYWMKVYTALTIRLNRLIKTVSLAQPDGGSASSLFKRMRTEVSSAVTGGSDPVHLLLDHSVPANASQLTVRARAYNATNCRIDRLQLQLVIVNSRQARIGVGQRSVADFDGQLEPGGCFEATFQVDVIRFGDVQVAVDVIFPGVEVEVEGEADDLDQDEHDINGGREAGAGSGRPADVGESGAEDRTGGPQAARNVTLRSAALTISFMHFLTPALEYELLLPCFQDLWSCLPFAHSVPVETDPATLRGVQHWLASSQAAKDRAALASSPRRRASPSAAGGKEAGGGPGSAADDIIRLMEAAPLYGNELLGASRSPHVASLREQARVTNKVRRVPFVAGSFFSEAWLFRTWSGHTLAVVLAGTGLPPGLQWRGRVEVRCNDQETFEKCVVDQEALARFVSFLSNGLFHVSDPKADSFQISSSTPSPVGGGLSSSLGPAAILPRWERLAQQRKILGLT